MNIDSRYPIRHCLPPGGSGERAADTLTSLAGYRRSPRGNNDAQLFAQTRTLRIRQGHSFDFSIVVSTSPLRAVAILTQSDFHEVSRAAGPKRQGRKTLGRKPSRAEFKGVTSRALRCLTLRDFHIVSRA